MINYLYTKFYAEKRYDGTHLFYSWIREFTNPNAVILNIGAGPPTEHAERIFKGSVKMIAGADIDRCVLSNPELDEAVLIENERIPYGDAVFDVVYSDYVLEHVERPLEFFAEAFRVLKPTGSFFFRTPNKYHYVALISAATPHWFHGVVANKARRNKEGYQEPWKTFYRVNSRAEILSLSRRVGFNAAEMKMVEMEPSYLRFSALTFAAGIAYERLVNTTDLLSGLRANIFGRLVK